MSNKMLFAQANLTINKYGLVNRSWR